MIADRCVRVTTCLIAALLASLQMACSTPPTNREVANQEVTHFHDKLNKGLYESIVMSGSEEFRSPGLGMTDYLKKLHEVAGEAQSSQLLTDSSQSLGGQALITMFYKTTFEHGSANETFVLGVKDGHARLVSYEIRGFPDLNHD